MKTFIQFILVNLLFIGASHASEVSLSDAKTVAQNFYRQNSTKAVSNITLAFTGYGIDGIPDYYIFNINDNDGFVIVTADYGSIPILAYNSTGHFVTYNLSPEFSSWMSQYAKSIDYIRANNLQPDMDINTEWNAYTQGFPNTGHRRIEGAVLPLTNIIWNQSPNFNALCPGGSVTGCCATAMAQVMKYWNYPLHGLLENTYNENKPQYSFNYGIVSRNFYTDTFKWASMSDTVNGPNLAVARLMYDCGIAIDMNYAPGGSNAEVITGDDSVCNQTAYIKFFGYNRHTIHGLYRSKFTDTAWITMLENELNNHRLVQYAGGGDIGHTWVCEGYNTNTQFYMNWGWGSADNGYFTLNNLNPGGHDFDSLEEMVIGIEPPAASAQFISDINSVHTGGTIKFTDESVTLTTITGWNWSFPGGTPASSIAKNPTVTYTTPGIYNVTLIVTASGGGDTITRYNFIAVQPDSNALPLEQTFESSPFPPAKWYLNNPDNWNTSGMGYGEVWQLYTRAGGGGFGKSNGCMLFDNYNYGYKEYLINQPPPPNPLGGQRQQIYTPAYDFSSVTSDSLSFDVAYAPFNSLYSDTLAIYYSLDCGYSWNNFYLKGGMNLATADSITGVAKDTLGFIPLPNQWRTENITLPYPIYWQTSVMFSFENRSYWGGQLYIDNIKIPGLPLSVQNVVNEKGDLEVYPNPSYGEFMIQSSGKAITVEVFNMLGQPVYSESFSILNSQFSINICSQPNGVYLYTVHTEDGELIGEGKLIIAR